MDCQPTAIDLFSGCGGLTTGLVMSGYNVIAAVEIERKALETYSLNHPSVRLYGDDIRQLYPDIVLSELGLEVGELDLLAGCPPCQSFSRLRKLNRTKACADPRNALIEDFTRFALAMKPKQIMMENVPGLSLHHRFNKMITAFKRAGYKVRWEVLDVQDYGVPQRRKRLIVSASRIGAPAMAVPNLARKSVRNAFAGLEQPGQSGDVIHDIKERRSEKVAQIIKNIPKDGGSRSELPDHLKLSCHKKTTGFSDVYGRMSWDKPSPTITSGCHNPSKGRFLHPDEDRTITLREAALLQGFPKDYIFDPSHGKEAIALMIGNALPPPFIAAHAMSMKISQESNS